MSRLPERRGYPDDPLVVLVERVTTHVARHANTTLARRRRDARLPFRVDVYLNALTDEGFAEDVRCGLSERPRWLLPKYLYDARGSALFDRITDLPEYYQARAELEILHREGPDLVRRHRINDVVELGSGSSEKARVLLNAMDTAHNRRYMPVDVSSSALLEAAGDLARAFPGLRIHALAADFEKHLDRVPPKPRRSQRLVAFLGGTVGNLAPAHRAPFLREVRGLLRVDDILLIGTDLVGDADRTRRAYDDAAGVTGEFNKNILRVISRRLEANFDPDRFDHIARWCEDEQRVEMRLRASEAMQVRVAGLDIDVALEAGEEILTELCCKFTRAGMETLYRASGMDLVEWHTDADGKYALSVATPTAPS